MNNQSISNVFHSKRTFKLNILFRNYANCLNRNNFDMRDRTENIKTCLKIQNPKTLVGHKSLPFVNRIFSRRPLLNFIKGRAFGS